MLNNPKTALREFLEENNRFVVDRAIENKLLFTSNPGGYLRCCADYNIIRSILLKCSAPSKSTSTFSWSIVF